ncbi:unnamed protein product [Cylicostephanus goldi]|uniref:Laminin N-terminal domain-containing protein n=1 Tax=Cylicostephanus goldi TaxID=71465 RepID=A0A3P7MI77_CYLGO|nr:unnamed protein product [Cylicostephanus goldi]
MGNAPRPGTWVLEKSLDGVNYEPWQYFATSDAECMRQFGIPATTGVPKYQRDDEVFRFICFVQLQSAKFSILTKEGFQVPAAIRNEMRIDRCIFMS